MQNGAQCPRLAVPSVCKPRCSVDVAPRGSLIKRGTWAGELRGARSGTTGPRVQALVPVANQLGPDTLLQSSYPVQRVRATKSSVSGWTPIPQPLNALERGVGRQDTKAEVSSPGRYRRVELPLAFPSLAGRQGRSSCSGLAAPWRDEYDEPGSGAGGGIALSIGGRASASYAAAATRRPQT